MLNADFARDLPGGAPCSLWPIDTAQNEVWTKVSHGLEAIRIPLGGRRCGGNRPLAMLYPSRRVRSGINGDTCPR